MLNNIKLPGLSWCTQTAKKNVCFFTIIISLQLQSVLSYGQSVEETFPLPVPKSLTLPKQYKFEKSFQAGPLCGPNAVYAILRIKKHRVNYQSVLDAIPVEPSRGAQIGTLAQVLSDYGLDGEVRKDVKPEELLNSPMPLILHVNAQESDEDGLYLDHYLVLTSVSDSNSSNPTVTYINTTDLVSARMRFSEVTRNMSGYCVVLKGTSFFSSSNLEGTLWITFYCVCFFLVILLVFRVFSLNRVSQK